MRIQCQRRCAPCCVVFAGSSSSALRLTPESPQLGEKPIPPGGRNSPSQSEALPWLGPLPPPCGSQFTQSWRPGGCHHLHAPEPPVLSVTTLLSLASCSPQFSPSRPCRPSCPFHRLLLWPDPSLCACFLVASLVLFSQARKALILWPSWSVPCPSWLSAALQPYPWAPRLLSCCLPTCLCLHWALCFAGTSVHTHRLAAPQDEVRWSCLSGAEPLAQGNLCLADMQTLIQTVFVKCSPGFWALRVKGKAPLGEPLMGAGCRHCD